MDPIAKFLRRVDAKLRSRLVEALGLIEKNALQELDIVSLQGKKHWFRCRVGDVRIIFFRSNEGKNTVYAVQFRGSAYKQ